MNLKTTYILFGVLAALFVALGVAVYLEPTPPEASDYLLPSVHKKSGGLTADEVDRVEIKRERPDAATIVFTREGDGKTWVVSEPSAMRADTLAVSGLVRDVLGARRNPQADQPTSLKEFGLEPPAEVITLKKGDREVWLHIGDTSPGKENQVVYVTSSDKPNEIAAVRKSELESVFKKVNDFRDRTLLASFDNDVKAVKLSDSKKKTAVALAKVDEGHWKYTEPAGYGPAEVEGDTPAGIPPADKPPSGVRPLLNHLTALRVDTPADFVADNVADGDLGKYHLDAAKDEVLRIEIDKAPPAKEAKKDGEKDEKEEKKPDVKAALLVGVGKAEDGKYYARLDGEKNIVKVAAREVDPLHKLLDDPVAAGALRDRNLVRFDNFKTPDAIEVKNAGPAFELLRAEGKPWELYRGDNGVKADDKAVQALIGDLTQKNVVRAFPAADATPASLGLDKPSAVVSLWVDGIAKEEKKEDKKDEKKEEKKDGKPEAKKEEKSARPKLKEPEKPTVRLTFGAVQDNLVAVKREAGGETAILKVPASVLEQVRNGPVAYLDRVLPKFNEADPTHDVTKLVIVRNGVTTELTKDPKASSPAVAWKLDKPADLAGRTADVAAVDGILRTLNNLRAVKLVSEKPEAEVVDREFGLKTPATKATVTLTKDGKATTYEYDFGKDVDATKVYARQGQRPDVVFEVEKADLAPLSRDLQDPTVFRFDPVKVKQLRLTGWKDVTGSPLVLDFERKDASTWSAKLPAGFTVSSEKVNRLAAELSSLRAVKFLGKKAAGKEREENALTADKGGLVIEATVEGEKEPFVLTVGNLDADKTAYLATSNRTGDSIFTVRKDPFEKAKEKPAFFSP